MRLSRIDKASKVVSVIEVEGGKEEGRGTREQGNAVNETVSSEVAVYRLVG